MKEEDGESTEYWTTKPTRISRTAWFRKVGGESQFTQGEIAGLRFELDLDDHQTAEIFFSAEVS